MVCILKHLKVGAVLHPLWAMRSCAIKFGFQPLRRGGIAEELTAGYSFLGGSMEGLEKKTSTTVVASKVSKEGGRNGNIRRDIQSCRR